LYGYDSSDESDGGMTPGSKKKKDFKFLKMMKEFEILQRTLEE